MYKIIMTTLLAVSLMISDGFAKSPPPGTGVDDVPANILIMMDASGSMSSLLPSDDVVRYPMDATYDSQGDIYVAEFFDVVKKFNSLGEYQYTLGGFDNGVPTGGLFDNVLSVATDSLDNVYVSDFNNGSVHKFSSSGDFVLKFDLAESGKAKGIAVDGSDIIYVANNSGNIEKFNSSGTSVGTLSVGASLYLAVDSSDNIWVTKPGPRTIVQYSSTGTLLTSFAVTFTPTGIGIDSSGNLHISSSNGDTMYEYSTAGVELSSWGEEGSQPGQLQEPRGIAINPTTDDVYVADFRNNRVQKSDGVEMVESGVAITRLEGAKNVIKSIVTDSNLTDGANFGLMEWHTNAQMWVDVSPDGASEIFQIVDSITGGGTTILDDAMDLAQSYFLGEDSPMEADASCQENILIVISDGFWADTTASATAASLYQNYGIKTFTVGFATTGNDNYITLSQQGGTYPSSPLYAEDEGELLDVLSNYIQEIISSSLTFSAPTIIPSSANDESILQSIFTYKTDNQWKGRLLKFELLADGHVGDLLWDAGDILNDRLADDRKIWTVATGVSSTLNNFTVSEMDRLRVPLEEYNSTSYSDDELTDLIEFIRGKDSYEEFPEDVDDEGAELLAGERWKLADLYHSKSSIVGPPSYYSSDETNPNSESYFRYYNGYRDFQDSAECGVVCNQRDEIIYAGSNSGMMHAFDSATGEELWAFIPPSMLGTLKGVISTTANTSNSIYGVDGSPTVKDIYYDGAWHTVLMAGLRQGGHSYFALDVTDPHNPSHLFTFSSKPTKRKVYYWDADGTRTDFPTTAPIADEYDFSGLGEAWSQPVMIKMKIGIEDKWVAVIGGGFNNGITPYYGAHLYVLDMEDGGKILQDIEIGDTISTNGIVSSVPPKVTAITADSTTLFQHAGALIYVNDLEGKMWQVNLTDQGTLYETTRIFNAESTNVNDRLVYHELAATINANNELMVFFGTGDMKNLGNISVDTANRAYGIREINFPTYVNTTEFTASALQNTTNPGECPDSSQKGWYLDFDANEKITAKATISNETVFLPRYTPNLGALCSPGSAKLSEISFMCGETISDIDLGDGVPTEAVIYNNKIYIGVSDDTETDLPAGFVKRGNLIVGDPSVIMEGEVRVESWKEDF